MRIHMLNLIASVTLLAIAGAAAAGPADDFNAAYARADAASKQAAALKTQWSTTVTALQAAKKAADAGDFASAVDLARHAEALANASIAQAKDEEKVWTEGVIR